MAETTAKKVLLKTVDGEYVLPYNGAVLSINGETPNSNGAINVDVGVKTVNGSSPDINGSVSVDVGVKTVNNVSPDSSGNVMVDSGGVKTVNNTEPDAAGNVNIKTPVDSIQGQTGAVTLYTAGTADLAAGTSELASGLLYFMYEDTSAASEASAEENSQSTPGEANNFVSSVNGFAGVVNLFTVSEEDIVEGSTGLETGKLYFVYE